MSAVKNITNVYQYADSGLNLPPYTVVDSTNANEVKYYWGVVPYDLASAANIGTLVDDGVLTLVATKIISGNVEFLVYG